MLHCGQCGKKFEDLWLPKEEKDILIYQIVQNVESLLFFACQAAYDPDIHEGAKVVAYYQALKIRKILEEGFGYKMSPLAEEHFKMLDKATKNKK